MSNERLTKRVYETRTQGKPEEADKKNVKRGSKGSSRGKRNTMGGHNRLSSRQKDVE